MLPLQREITNQLDKASIIRLAINYLKLIEFFERYNFISANSLPVLRSPKQLAFERTEYISSIHAVRVLLANDMTLEELDFLIFPRIYPWIEVHKWLFVLVTQRCQLLVRFRVSLIVPGTITSKNLAIYLSICQWHLANWRLYLRWLW